MPVNGPPLIEGDAFILALAKWLRSHERRLGEGTAVNLLPGRRAVSQGSWLSPASNTPVVPLTLTLDPHHLFYLLLRFEEAGLTEQQTGPLGIELGDLNLEKPMNLVSILKLGGDLAMLRGKDKSETSSILSAVSSSLSFGSSWWSSSAPAQDPKQPTLNEARYIYSVFTRLPSLNLSPFLPPAPLNAFVRDFETLPDALYVPLYTFKNLQSLSLDNLDPRGLLGWDFLADSLKTLEIKNSGLQDIAHLFVDCVLNDNKRRKGQKLTQEESNPSEAVENEEQGQLDTSKILPSGKWQNLRKLSLASNDITFISSCPWAQFDSLVTLDLSANLLVAIPSGLSSLISLRSLNLSNNMIDSILSISSLLGAIVNLNLARNRLTSLCGLERLYNLRSIDVTGNQLSDSGEIGRLTSLPHLQEVWSEEGNPFSLRYNRQEWRIGLFSSFAQQGNTAVKLDGSGPSWQESRYITNNPKSQILPAKEPQPTPTSISRRSQQQRRTASSFASFSTEKAATPAPSVPPVPVLSPSTSKQPTSTHEPQSSPKVIASKPKKRKAARRVVNLDGTTSVISPPATSVNSFVTAAESVVGSSAEPSRVSSPAQPSPSIEEEEAVYKAHQRAATEPQTTESETVKTQSIRPRYAGRESSGRSSTLGRKLGKRTNSRSTIINSTIFDAPQEVQSGQPEVDFRKKIEALRNEVGENYLSVLAKQNDKQ